MNPKKNASQSDAKLKKRREQKRKSMQKARDKIKADEALHEEAKLKERQRWHERKKQGKVKLIQDLSERDKRRVRKNWREGYKRSVDKKNEAKEIDEFINLNSPPPSEIDGPTNNQAPSTSRVDSGKRKARKNREALRKKLKSVEDKCEKLEKKLAKYKKRNQRLKSKLSNTPPTKRTPKRSMEKILRDTNLDSRIKKRLFMNEIICQQVKNKFHMEKSRKLKRKWVSLFTGTLIEKYKCVKYAEYLTTFQLTRVKVKQHKESFKKSDDVKQAVIKFLEEDKCSRICPGKKDTVTNKKIKKQKRFLNDTLKHLHKKFCSETKYKNVSYATFCRYRPFWIRIPSVNQRDTCLCKIHENFAFVVAKLKNKALIEQNSTTDILKSLCCKESKKNCLERTCKACKDKKILFNDCDSWDEKIKYEKWISKSVPIIIKNEEKISKRTIKIEIECSKKELVEVFEKSLPKFVEHSFNIHHQYEVVDHVKKSLAHDEVLLHFDFSENYTCKYGKEIQSVHFGGSKQQISLHTSVLYYSDSLSGELRHQSFATVSENTRHDPVAIVAHLEPITTKIKQLVPTLKTVHFLSDGPSTQYRNKTMFQLLGSQLTNMLTAEMITWHFSESSHGKGAPDGIGGTIKRTADSLVAKGADIDNFDKFVAILQENMLSIKIIPITSASISYYDKLKPEAKTFKGTNKIHQVTYQKGANFMEARRLSCATCSIVDECTHYGLGKIELQQIDQIHQEESESEDSVDAWDLVKKSSDEPRSCASKKTLLKLSDVYSSEEDEPSSEPFRPMPYEFNDLKIDTFIVVSVPMGKKTKNFLAIIQGEILPEREVEVMYFVRCGNSSTFRPDEHDIGYISCDQIVGILPSPQLINKGHRIFYKFRQNVVL